MQHKIAMVVFDMAGTTVNENNLVYKTLKAAINNAGFEFSLEQVLAEGAGKEKKQAIRAVLSAFAGIEDEQLTTNIYDEFIVALQQAYEKEEILPQPNAIELFNALRERGILVVLNTGYDKATASAILEKLNWREGQEIDGLVTASDVLRNRPQPDMIELAMERFGVMESNRVVKVGDSAIDIEEGRNAGCGINIGITTGAHTTDQLQSANPNQIIDNLIDLLPIIDK